MPELSSISPEQFKQVLEVSRLLAVTTELDLLLDEIVRHCCAMLGCERASIFLHEPKTDELWTKIALGSKEIRVPANSGIVGFVFKSNQLFHCKKPYEDSRFNPEPDRRSGFVTRNLLTAPMLNLKGEPVGVIQAVNKISRDHFTGADESLIQLLADQAGVAMQRYRLQQEAIEGAELRREMDLAKTVQQALIPSRPPEIAGVKSIGWTLSASITGGDSFDLWKLADGRLGIFLGDASGHGIAPALVVSQARTLVRAMCDLNPDPHEMLSLTNARLNADLESGRFVTAFVGILDRGGLLHWSSAGHGPVLVMRTREGEIETLNPPGPPLGVMGEFLAERCEPIQFAPGGVLLVMSDGIFEAFNPGGKQFGVENVHELLRAWIGDSPGELLQSIQSAVHVWQGKLEPVDDQTLVIAQLE
ncbi:MAG TPA: GAF domain-containing SpoIIE family protein phosphatase [Tepidisphaeraceae bacterium]|jgi:phosphoserine phosphatase|nr:GAF domain-containing SpoIIE family protein phosphatase [Tepidisphaeraceae bacterium]